MIDLADEEEAEPNPLVFINPEVTVLDPEPYPTRRRVPFGARLLSNSLSDLKQGVSKGARQGRGKPFEIEAEGLLAVCVQHEIDHLNGKLFVDYLSVLKRQRIKSKLEKEHKQKTSA